MIRDKAIFDDDFVNLDCVKGDDTDECIKMIDQEEAHVMSLDAGEVFIAGRYFSLIPIMQETIEGGLTEYQAVALVKANSLPDVHHIRDLRGKKACFAYVGSQAGWNLPIHTLMKDGGMRVVDCNNHVKNAIEFFGKSCAVNSLINKYNPIGDNSDKLCQICVGKVPGGWCTPDDPYVGFDGAFRCLIESGDIAFLLHTTVQEMLQSKAFKGVQENQFELLCRDGQRMPVSEYLRCNWGAVPTNAIVTSSARRFDQRKKYQRFLNKAVSLYSKKSSLYNSTYSANNEQNNGQGRFNPDRYNPYSSSYSTTTTNRYDRNRNSFGTSSTTEAPLNSTQKFEHFDLFESERYEGRLNLMFTVIH
jgi:melanoma-associated antigen p97